MNSVELLIGYLEFFPTNGLHVVEHQLVALHPNPGSLRSQLNWKQPGMSLGRHVGCFWTPALARRTTVQ